MESAVDLEADNTRTAQGISAKTWPGIFVSSAEPSYAICLRTTGYKTSAMAFSSQKKTTVLRKVFMDPRKDILADSKMTRSVKSRRMN